MTTSATSLRDRDARIHALSRLDRSLLVEAGAGSGKTAVLAGRIVMLLVSGGRAVTHRGRHVHRAGGG